ncbi:ferredoxin--NADP+ reductase [Brevundimonas faecalis]|uniref:ferredoxin--NADP(+) reductase n=1 Tax=Brevundimonas faecalis TaxID=947378 RepID=A0ABV2RBU8_9CAUL
MSEVASLERPRPAVAAPWTTQRVRWVRHWTEHLFSFAIDRPEDFRFRSGEFVMIGLPATEGGKPTLRAYSIASPSWAEELEFFSIRVEDGPLTSRLVHIQPGDEVLLGRKPTGTLVLDALKPGRRLFLIGTGTGLAPWLSVARDPETYARFERVVTTHTVRQVADLAYRDFFTRDLFEDPLIGEEARGQLTYYPTVTRDAFERPGRITDRIADGRFFADLGLGPGFDPDVDRVMLCGSTAMIRETAALLESHGLVEGSNAEPGDYVLERAFVG